MEISGRKVTTQSGREISGWDHWLSATPAAQTVRVGLRTENEGALHQSGARWRKKPRVFCKTPTSGGGWVGGDAA